MASKDDMILASTSASTSQFKVRFDEEESGPSKQKLSLNKVPATNLSRSVENLKSTSFIDTFGSPLSCHVIRLHPGQEFRKSLLDFISEKKLKAPFIMTCIGSAKSAKLRLASAVAGDTNYLLDLQGPLEIVSVSGTFGVNRQCHLHASLANTSGKVQGGHLIELIVHTTAEVVIGECTAMVFQRTLDKATGFTELEIQER